jgi:hypothetical protein
MIPVHSPRLERARGFLLGGSYAAGMSDQPSPGRPGRRGWRGPPGWRDFAIVLCLAVMGIALGLIFKLW